MSGSSGSLTAHELRRYDLHERDVEGARVTVAEQGETVHDPRTSPVTTDGAASQAQLASLSHAPGALVTPSSTRRTRTRSGRPVTTPERPVYERPVYERSEAQIVHSTIEGILDRVNRLEIALQHLLQAKYPNGVPMPSNESETL